MQKPREMSISSLEPMNFPPKLLFFPKISRIFYDEGNPSFSHKVHPAKQASVYPIHIDVRESLKLVNSHIGPLASEPSRTRKLPVAQ